VIFQEMQPDGIEGRMIVPREARIAAASMWILAACGSAPSSAPQHPARRDPPLGAFRIADGGVVRLHDVAPSGRWVQFCSAGGLHVVGERGGMGRTYDDCSQTSGDDRYVVCERHGALVLYDVASDSEVELDHGESRVVGRSQYEAAFNDREYSLIYAARSANQATKIRRRDLITGGEVELFALDGIELD
jgi:hypothetical protein